MKPLSTQQWTVVEPVLTACCVDVFHFYQFDVTRRGEECKLLPDQEAVAATLGLGGDQLKGSLVLISCMPLLRRAYPEPIVGGKPFNAEQAQDWLGEVANQLAGILKTRLCAQGVSFQLSLPTCMTGRGLSSVHASPGLRRTLSFRDGHLFLTVELYAQISPTVVLAPPSLNPSQSPASSPPGNRTLL